VALGVTIVVRVGTSSVFVLTIIGVEVGSSREVTMMSGNAVDVGCAGGLVSASESEIPPITNRREMMAIRTPPPI
jgi:hypothetical protein